MRQATEEIAIQFANASKNKRDWGNILFNAKVYGAEGDGVTDDSAAINAAITAASNAGGGTALLPPGQYYVDNTVNILAQCDLVGVGNGQFLGHNASEIIAAKNLAVAININGGAGSGACGLKNLSVTRDTTASTIPSNTIGVSVNATDYTLLENVNVFFHDRGIVINGQLGVKLLNCLMWANVTAHARVSNSPQINFEFCSFGRNGGDGGIPVVSHVEITGSTDTLAFIRCQFNNTSTGATNCILFSEFNNPNGIVYFNACHAEAALQFIASDATTPSIQRLLLSSCSINLEKFANLNAATSIVEWCITGCEITCSVPWSFTKGRALTLTGNRIAGDFTIGNQITSANVTGNMFFAGLSLTGAFNQLVAAFNTFDSGVSQINDTSTGRKSIMGNVSNSGVPNPNVLPDDYLTLGGGVSFAIKRYTGTLDASGSALIPHGITSGQYAGLIVQAFFRGPSTEMKPLTIVHVDGTNISVNGGTANQPYRVTFIYSNSQNVW